MQAGCSLLVPAETAALVGQAERGDSAEHSKGKCSKGIAVAHPADLWAAHTVGSGYLDQDLQKD